MRTKNVLILALQAVSGFAQIQAVTETPTNINSGSATLIGRATPSITINAGVAQFRVGAGVPLQPTDKLVGATPIAGAEEKLIAVSISDLAADTTYCYQLEVSTSSFTAAQPTCFTTLAAAAPFVAVGYSDIPVSGSGTLIGVSGSLLRVTGDRFNSDSRIMINQSVIPAQVVSQQEVQFVLPLVSETTVVTLRVFNGQSSSNSVQLVILAGHYPFARK